MEMKELWNLFLIEPKKQIVLQCVYHILFCNKIKKAKHLGETVASCINAGEVLQESNGLGSGGVWGKWAQPVTFLISV